MKVFKLLTLSLILLAGSLQAQRVITGQAVRKNPTISCLFQGFNAEQQKALISFITASGWLTVEQKLNTDYQLRLSSKEGIIKADISGSKKISINIRAKSARGNDIARYTADQILAAIFNDKAKICDSRIAFSGFHKGRKEIFTMNINGTDIRQVTNYNSRSVEVDWSSDNRSLAFTTYTADGTMIIHKDLNSGKHRILSRYRGLNSGAAFDPTGRFIALTLSKSSKLNLYWLDLKSPKKGGFITNDSRINSSPAWSPDGKLLCYVSSSLSSSKKIGTPQLYLTAPGKADKRALFTDHRERVSPDWSATSGLLTYAKKMGRDYAIAICNPRNPQSEKILTRTAGSWEAPSWAPDGRHIVCSRAYNGSTRLCIIDTKLNKIRQINLPFEASLPNWSGILNP